jgi:DNA (cytosine-5)-methyltransferase 1
VRYLSVCSGIEAATVAWHGLGWQPVGFSEIEPFPSAVLAHHYPKVPNLGDMTRYKEWDIGTIDLLVGGTPCQSFSVAGLRKGLEDPRGNLALVYCGILDHFRPKWFVWENVPGVLSSAGGRDFGSFLGALAQLGYGFAYRVLDAQFFGVAQRRRRVFVVGCLGDWRPAAAVLFERQSLRRDTAPSREKGQDPAKCLTTGSSQRCDAESETMIPVGIPDVMSTLLSSTAGISRPSNASTEHETYIPMAQPIAWDEELNPSIDVAGTIVRGGQGGRHDGVAQPIAVDVYNQTIDGQVSATLTEACGGTNTSGPKVMQPVAYRPQNFGDKGGGYVEAEITNTLDAIQGSKQRHLAAQSMQVRRLTPVECERLQGFPDKYTAIPWRGKTETPDGPRYKALGNSMAVPVMKWIGEKIQRRAA